MTTKKKRGGPGNGQGRHKIGEDRGGLVQVLVSVFGDQAEWLKERGNQSLHIRIALDSMMEKSKEFEKKLEKKKPGKSE